MQTIIKISDEHIANVICSGIESGIHYWCDEIEVSNIKCDDVDEIMLRYWQPLLNNGWIKLHDREENSWHIIDMGALQKAIQIILDKYPHHIGALIGDFNNQDALTGDVLIQCAIFGDIIYG